MAKLCFLGNGGGLKTASGSSFSDLREMILVSNLGEIVFANESGVILEINKE